MVTDLQIYNKILSKILEEQETILGSLAWQIVEKVQGIHVVNKETWQVRIISDPKVVIDQFVYRCERIFGSFARDVSKQAVAFILANIPEEDIPERLRQ
jgi:hypothetical protein